MSENVTRKLWLLTRKDRVEYFEYDSFVVRAETEKEARELAQKQSGWTTEENVDCMVLLEDGESEVILGSFNAG